MRLSVVPLAALLVTLSACGGEDDTAKAASTPSPTATSSPTPRVTPSVEPSVPADAGLRDAVQAYSDAFLGGDAAKAYGLLSSRCQKRTTAAEFEGIVKQASAMYGSPLKLKTYDAQVSGDLARVTYTYDVPALNQEQEPWARESGAWHQDDC